MNACDEVNRGGERYGFARVCHVADPNAKQNPPASATLGPPVSQVPSQQWPVVNFDTSGPKAAL
jgi:hypothetical protein